MKRSIIDKQTEIQKLKEQIESIQNKCQHTNVEHKHGSNTSNYDPAADIWILYLWTDYHCLDCDKRWTKYSK